MIRSGLIRPCQEKFAKRVPVKTKVKPQVEVEHGQTAR